MAKIQILRGNKADLPLEAPLGQPIFCENTGELFIGRGTGASPTLIGIYLIDDNSISSSTTYSGTKVSNLIDILASVRLYKGSFDITSQSLTDIVNPKAGDMYYISGGGQLGNLTFNQGDLFIIMSDIIGSPESTDLNKIKNTYDEDVLFKDSSHTVTNKTISSENNTIVVDGDNSTISNISLTSLKSDLSKAGGFLRRDEQGNVITAMVLTSSDVAYFSADVLGAIGGLFVDTNTVVLSYDDQDDSMLLEIQYQDTDSIMFSEDSNGLKAELIYQDTASVTIVEDENGIRLDINVDNESIKIDNQNGLYVNKLQGGAF